MGLGTELLFILIVGLLVLGPRQLHTLVGHVARAKTRFDEASRGFKSQLAAEFHARHQEGDAYASHELVGDDPGQQSEQLCSDHPCIHETDTNEVKVE